MDNSPGIRTNFAARKNGANARNETQYACHDIESNSLYAIMSNLISHALNIGFFAPIISIFVMFKLK